MTSSVTPADAHYDVVEHRVEWSGTIPAGVISQEAGWEDTDEGSVTYQWLDATDGLALPKEDDAFFGPFELGFAFPFWGEEYARLYVNTNGMVTFGGGSASVSNTTIASASSPNSFIAAYWDDLDPSAGGRIYFKAAGMPPDRRAIIEWSQVPRYGSDEGLSFEIVLYEDGRIMIQYRSLTGSYADGHAASVGMENVEGTEGVQYVGSGTGQGFPLHGALAVLLQQPRTQSLGEQRVSFRVKIDDDIPSPSTITNVATIDDGLGHRYERSAFVQVNPRRLWLPFAVK